MKKNKHYSVRIYIRSTNVALAYNSVYPHFFNKKQDKKMRQELEKKEEIFTKNMNYYKLNFKSIII